jgi:hypothetical protein
MIVTNKDLPISVKEGIQRIKKGGKLFQGRCHVAPLKKVLCVTGGGGRQRIISPLPNAITLKSEATYMVTENQSMKHECNLEYNQYKQVWVE